MSPVGMSVVIHHEPLQPSNSIARSGDAAVNIQAITVRRPPLAVCPPTGSSILRRITRPASLGIHHVRLATIDPPMTLIVVIEHVLGMELRGLVQTKRNGRQAMSSPVVVDEFQRIDAQLLHLARGEFLFGLRRSGWRRRRRWARRGSGCRRCSRRRRWRGCGARREWRRGGNCRRRRGRGRLWGGSGRRRGRGEQTPAHRDGHVVLHRLREQAALMPQPDRPGECCGTLAGNGPAFEPVRVHQEIGYLQARLEHGHAAARLDRRQAVEVVQSGVEHGKTLRERGVHLLPAPAARPLAPLVRERLRRLPSGRWRCRGNGRRGRRWGWRRA